MPSGSDVPRHVVGTERERENVDFITVVMWSRSVDGSTRRTIAGTDPTDAAASLPVIIGFERSPVCVRAAAPIDTSVAHPLQVGARVTAILPSFRRRLYLSIPTVLWFPATWSVFIPGILMGKFYPQKRMFSKKHRRSNSERFTIR